MSISGSLIRRQRHICTCEQQLFVLTCRGTPPPPSPGIIQELCRKSRLCFLEIISIILKWHCWIFVSPLLSILLHLSLPHILSNPYFLNSLQSFIDCACNYIGWLFGTYWIGNQDLSMKICWYCSDWKSNTKY